MVIEEGAALWGTAELDGQPSGIDVPCFQQEPHRIGPDRGKAKQGKRPAAPVAELGAERVVRVLEHGVEQTFRPDPGVAAALAARAAMTKERLAGR